MSFKIVVYFGLTDKDSDKHEVLKILIYFVFQYSVFDVPIKTKNFF